MESETIQLIAVGSAVSSAIAAIASVVIAQKLSKITVAAASPNVIVVPRTGTGEDKHSMFLVIRNIGGAVAFNVRFELRDIAQRRGFLTQGGELEEFEDGPLITGISALGPGEERCVLWGMARDLWNSTEGKSGLIVASYTDSYRDEAERWSTENPIAIHEFESHSLEPSDSMRNLARKGVTALEKLERTQAQMLRKRGEN